MTHGEKVELLQNARATLFPIEWEEPFGLVMIESMACGTPVIATRWGAVPEVIEDGRTGIIVDDYRDMAGALAAADALEPSDLRHAAEERFSRERMVDDYLRAFEVGDRRGAVAQAGGGQAYQCSTCTQALNRGRSRLRYGFPCTGRRAGRCRAGRDPPRSIRPCP